MSPEILVLGDYASMVELFCQRLAGQNTTPLLVEDPSAAQAVELVEGKHPDLLIIDHQYDRSWWVSVVLRARRCHPRMSVFIVSDDKAATEGIAGAAGIQSDANLLYFEKPLDIQNLYSELERFLERSSS